jgi:hypothetical protein
MAGQDLHAHYGLIVELPFAEPTSRRGLLARSHKEALDPAGEPAVADRDADHGAG